MNNFPIHSVAALVEKIEECMRSPCDIFLAVCCTITLVGCAVFSGSSSDVILFDRLSPLPRRSPLSVSELEVLLITKSHTLRDADARPSSIVFWCVSFFGVPSPYTVHIFSLVFEFFFSFAVVFCYDWSDWRWCLRFDQKNGSSRILSYFETL